MEHLDNHPILPTPIDNRRGRQRTVLFAVAVVGLGSFFLFQRYGNTQPSSRNPASPSNSANPAAAAQRGTPVTVATAEKGDISDYVNALGYVTPVYTVNVRSRVDGELLKINYREGQVVHQGDVLAEIDPRLFQAQLLQAEGQYDRDKALLDEAYIDLARYKEAYARNAIPKQTLDIQQATVHQDEGTLKVDRGQVETATVNLQYCTIRSPITGRVGLRLLDPGNIVHAADANGIVVITQIQPITVVFSVAEDYLSQVRSQMGRQQRLMVDAMDRTQQTMLGSGTVSAVDNQIDATTGTVRLRAQFANQNSALFPNQFINARLVIRTLRNVTLVPTAAIQRNGETTYVYLINPDQTAKMQNITVSISNEDRTAVDGINPGAEIAVDGFDKLQDGAKVTIIRGSKDGANNANGANGQVQQQSPTQPNGKQGGQQQGPAGPGGQGGNR